MQMFQGAVGFCHEKQHSIGVLISLDANGNAADVDCAHATCGHSHICQLYRKCLEQCPRSHPNPDGTANL